MTATDGRHGLHVTEHPAANGAAGEPIVVLVHGSMDRSTSFAKVLRHLADLHVVRYDRRGYGRSVAAGVTDVDGHVADLLAVVDGRPTVVVGHSIGGVLALTAATRRPDVIRAVGAYEAPMAWLPWWSSVSAGGGAMAALDGSPLAAEDAAERFIRRMIGDERWERLPASTRAARRQEGPALVAELGDLRTPPPPYDPADVAVPVVAAHGSACRPHHLTATRALAAGAPDAELVVIQGAGHGAHTSHPEDFAGLVRRVAARGA